MAFLRAAKDLDVTLTPPEAAQVKKHIADTHALLIRDDFPIDASMLADAQRLKVIGRAGVGLAGIDVEAATARGVIVMNTPGANSVATAEYTLALMLAMCRQVIAAHADLKAGAWTRDAHLRIELYGKTLGLV